MFSYCEFVTFFSHIKPLYLVVRQKYMYRISCNVSKFPHLGPLSSGSFMMSLRNRKSISRETTPESISLRSRRSTSRETTPEPRNMSDLSSVATEDDIGKIVL